MLVVVRRGVCRQGKWCECGVVLVVSYVAVVVAVIYSFFFFNDTATTEIYTLSLHDALPISTRVCSYPWINYPYQSLFLPLDEQSPPESVHPGEIGRAHV